jgi:hypothetical protein
MPEVSKTEIGRRFYKIQKDKGVEKAIAKVRRSMGVDWQLYTHDDIEALKYILGQSWVYIDRDAWEKISFSQLTMTDVRALITAGNDALNKKVSEETAVETSKKILLP